VLLHFTTIHSIPWEQNVSDSFENYVTVGEAAKRLNIHPESVRRLIRTGKLSARKFANTWLIERAMLEQFANHYDPRPGKKATLL
jgi:excisionase family DNA binding protein